ncbi:MAG TPA: HU family DNA-binding protein [Coxiellaceae bacterium]|nr:HU family DNA-binding protein [Coxiellaceae bacterium]
MPARKKTTRKPARKAAAKKAPKASKKMARKAAVAKKPVVKTPVRKPFSKSEVFTNIAEETGVARRDVGAVFSALGNVIERHIKKGGPGQMNIPGLMKLRVVRKPATKARKGINPFTGEPCTFKAKPARNVVRVRPLKGLKDMV